VGGASDCHVTTVNPEVAELLPI